MAVLSVDLAYRRWSDLGIVVLSRAERTPWVEKAASGSGLQIPPLFAGPDEAPPAEGTICCEMIPSSNPGDDLGPVDANILAGRLSHLCNVRGIQVMMLDGPQAWKSRSNGLEYSRVSERQLNTAAKTGLPGMVKPVTYRPFAEFCLDVYEALGRRGWRRLATLTQPGTPPERVVAESYPHAAWKSLGIKPLPSKRRAHVSDLAEAYGALRQLIPITTSRPPNHDQLQAIVGGLAGLALEERNTAGARIVGDPPRREDGHWREGFIVLPVAPAKSAKTDWLNSIRWLD